MAERPKSFLGGVDNRLALQVERGVEYYRNAGSLSKVLDQPVIFRVHFFQNCLKPSCAIHVCDGKEDLPLSFPYVHHVEHEASWKVLWHFGQCKAYWGQEHSPGEIEKFLRKKGIRYRRFDCEEKLIERIVDELQAGKVVGWFQDRFEWGPRALGNRSILADPRRADMRDIVNVKIKFREPFRPFAPSVLAECAEE